jgi:hypothetical protein
MPTDLFATNNTTPAPVDLFQQNGINVQPQQTQSNPSFVPRVTQDVLSGLFGGIANTGQLAANIPNAVMNIPHDIFGVGPQINVANPNMQIGGQQDFTKTLGIPDPNLGDRFLEGIGQYAPINAVADATTGAKLLPKTATYLQGVMQRAPSQAFGGALYGATQNQDNGVTGSAVGAGLGTLNSLVPGLGAVANMIRPQKYASAIIDNIGNLIQKSQADVPACV